MEETRAHNNWSLREKFNVLRIDTTKNPEMGRLSWIILVGPNLMKEMRTSIRERGDGNRGQNRGIFEDTTLLDLRIYEEEHEPRSVSSL